MNKLKQKIAALLTVGISVLPSASFNNVKANETLRRGVFVENFEKKNIPVYKTANNLLVDANLNYINGEGKLLGKYDQKVSVSDELKDTIQLHFILQYINNNKNDFIFTKSEFDDERSHIFVKTSENGKLKMLYFNSDLETVGYTDKAKFLVDSGIVNDFGDAVPELKEPEESERKSLITKLQSEASSIKNKNKEKNVVTPNKSDDNLDSYIATGVTGLVGVGLAGYILSNLSGDGSSADLDLY